MKRLLVAFLLLFILIGLLSACKGKDTIACSGCEKDIQLEESFIRHGKYYCEDCYFGEVK